MPLQTENSAVVAEVDPNRDQLSFFQKAEEIYSIGFTKKTAEP
jgi:hypothetical protein